MLKQKVTILFIGLMCFNLVSGFLTVMCHGSDGHVAMEPVGHNHCERQESCETGNQNDFTVSVIAAANNHDHCKDTIAISNFIVPVRKNFKLSTHRIFTANLFLKSR